MGLWNFPAETDYLHLHSGEVDNFLLLRWSFQDLYIIHLWGGFSLSLDVICPSLLGMNLLFSSSYVLFHSRSQVVFKGRVHEVWGSEFGCLSCSAAAVHDTNQALQSHCSIFFSLHTLGCRNACPVVCTVIVTVPPKPHSLARK